MLPKSASSACASCGHVSPSEARFCAACGRALRPILESERSRGDDELRGWSVVNLLSLFTLIGLPVFLIVTGLAHRYPPLLLLCGFGIFGFGIWRGGRRSR